MGTHWEHLDPDQQATAVLLERRARQLQVEAHKDASCSPGESDYKHPLLRYGISLRRTALRVARQRGIGVFHNHLVSSERLTLKAQAYRRESIEVQGVVTGLPPTVDRLWVKQGESDSPMKPLHW